MLITSNVFNLIDWTENGVEPRIGNYIQNIVLTELFTNYLQGPNFPLVVRFNQYSASDEGFGTGWELNLSSIETMNNRRLLRLAKGARYWIVEQTGTIPAEGRILTLQSKQNETFWCKELPSGEVQIYYKNGIREVLRQGLTREIHHANGGWLTLAWQEEQRYLSSITDSVGGTVVVSLSYTENNGLRFVDVTQPRRTDIYTVRKNDNCQELRSVTVSTGTPSGGTILYDFSYQHYNDRYLLITEFNSPAAYNKKEVIRYADVPRPNGLTLVIKAVDKLSLYYGKVGEDSKHHDILYSFGSDEHNFLGFGSGGVTQWDASKDNLESLNNYQYMRIETSASKEIQSTWQRYYLLLQQQVRPMAKGEENRKQVVEYQYQLTDPDNSAEVWPAYFLPIKITRCGWENNQAGSKSEEIYRFDRYGNQLENHTVGGTHIVRTYYNGRQNHADCPKDPYDFDNYIQQQRIIPADISIGYEKRESYTYLKLATSQLVVLNKKILARFDLVTKVEVRYEEYEYTYADSGNILGELKHEKHWVYTRNEQGEEKSTLQETRYDLFFDHTEKILRRQCTMLGLEEGETTTSYKIDERVIHYLTGDHIRLIDNSGYITQQFFDDLGRTTKKTQFFATEQQQTEEVIYFDDHVERTLSHNPTMRWRIIRDRREQVTEEQVKVGAGAWLPTMQYEYDEHGRVIKTTEYDYQEERFTRIITAETSMQWDYLDNLISRVSSYEQPERVTYNYALRVKELYGVSDEMVQEECDTLGRLIRKTEFSSAAKKVGEETYHYDGLGRQTQVLRKDRRGQTIRDTQFKYDIYDRVTETTTAVGTEVQTQTSQYDSRFSEAKRVKQMLNQRQLEANTYDKMGRLTSTQKDKASIDLSYSAYGQATPLDQPESMTVLNGRKFDYTYRPDGRVKTQSLALSVAPHRSWQRTFEFDRISGALKSAVSQQQFSTPPERIYTQSEQYTYSAKFGFLSHNALVWQHQQGNQQVVKSEDTEIKYSSSLSGRLLSAGNDEYRETYTYSAQGRLTNVLYEINNKEQCRLQLAYDDKQRLEKIILETRLEDNTGRNRALFTHTVRRYRYDRQGRIGQLDYQVLSTASQLQNLLSVKLRYDSQQNITQIAGKMIAPPEQTPGGSFVDSEKWWQEDRTYNGYGNLTDWEHQGDLLLVDEQGHTLVGQSITYHPDGLMDTCTTRFSSGPSDVMAYFYETGSAQLARVTHTPAGQGYPAEETFQWNEEGQLRTRTRTDGYQETYYYGGENNLISLTITYPKIGQHSQHFIYDAFNRQVIQTAQMSPATDNTLDTDTYQRFHDIYMNDQHAIRRVFKQENATTPDMVIYFHRLFDQVLAVSVRDNSAEGGGKVVSGFHLNLPDGSTLAKCFQINRNRLVELSFPQAYVLEIQWVGQNAAGFIYEPVQTWLQLYSITRTV